MATPKPTRMPVLPESEWTPEQKALAEKWQTRRGPVVLGGPYQAWMRHPALAERIQHLGAYNRFDMKVPARLREFVILAICQFWKAQFAFHAHIGFGEEYGLSAQTIEDVRAGRRPSSAPEDELAIYDLLRELYETKRVSDATYDHAVKLIGENEVIELMAVAGFYTMVSMSLNVFRINPAPHDMPFEEP